MNEVIDCHLNENHALVICINPFDGVETQYLSNNGFTANIKNAICYFKFEDLWDDCAGLVTKDFFVVRIRMYNNGAICRSGPFRNVMLLRDDYLLDKKLLEEEEEEYERNRED